MLRDSASILSNLSGSLHGHKIDFPQSRAHLIERRGYFRRAKPLTLLGSIYY